MPRKSKVNSIYIISALLILHLCGILFVKYHINDLHIKVFKMNYLGNIFNILIALLIIIGFLISHFLKKGYEKRDLNLITLFTVILFLPVIPVIILNGSNISFSGSYWLGIPIKKVYLGLLFFVEIFFQLYLLFIVWGFVIDQKYFSYIRSVYYSAISILFLLIFTFFYSGDINGRTTFSDDKEYNVAVILGAAVWRYDKPSPIFEGRIKKAYELYARGIVAKIQLTGGNAPGEISEAETAYNYLSNLGVDDEDIIIEKSTSTTTEQISFIKKDLVQNHDYKSIVIISDGFHLKRILEICKFFDIDAVGIPSGHEIKWERLLYYRVRESIALLMFWFYAI